MSHMILLFLCFFVVVILAEAFCSAMRAKRWRPFHQPRDVIYMKGYESGEEEKAQASADAIRESYDRARMPRPIILTVPRNITLTRDPAR